MQKAAHPGRPEFVVHNPTVFGYLHKAEKQPRTAYLLATVTVNSLNNPAHTVLAVATRERPCDLNGQDNNYESSGTHPICCIVLRQNKRIKAQ